jgi:hypothetical protein
MMPAEMRSRTQHTIAASPVLLTVLAAIAFGSGCAAPPNEKKPGAPSAAAAAPPANPSNRSGGTEPISNTDPCVDQLHEWAGALLLYYGKNRHLPEDVRELAKQPGFDDLQFTCPVSHQPYVYNPRGLPGLRDGTHLILYDAAPSHGSAVSGGMRLAVQVDEPRGGDPLVAKVVAVPEARFRLAAQQAGRP